MSCKILRRVFLGFVAIVLLAGGAGSDTTANVFLLALLVLLMASVLFAPVRPDNNALFLRCLLVSGLLSNYVGFQVSAIGYPAFAEKLGIAGRDLVVQRDWLSVAPGDSVQALLVTLLPFTACLVIARICPDRHDAIRLFQQLLIVGTFLGLLTFLQHILFPDFILFREKRYYLKEFTASFVGKNVAGNFLGVLLIALATYWGHIAIRDTRSNASRRQRTRVSFAWVYMIGILVGALLLLLVKTESRASSIFAVSCGILSLLISFIRQSRRQGGLGYGRFFAALAAILVTLFFFFDPIVSRFSLHGWDNLRACFYRSTWDIIRDHWMFGTGLGTFPHVYPLYRLPECGLSGVLIRAHSFLLEGWATLGVIFVALTSYIVLLFGRRFIGAMRVREPAVWIPQACVFILVFELCHNGIDFSIQNAGLAIYVASLLSAGYLSTGVALGQLQSEAMAPALDS